MLNRRSTIVSVFVALALCLGAQNATAQETPKIATVDLARVFNELQETKDFRQKMEADQKASGDELRRRGAELEDKRKQLAIVMEGSDEFNKKFDEITRLAVEANVFKSTLEAKFFRLQKTQLKTQMTKIEESVKVIAEAKKVDIVLVDQKFEFPKEMENINAQQLQQIVGMINQRSMLYNNGKFDMTNEVIAALDAKYKQK